MTYEKKEAELFDYEIEYESNSLSREELKEFLNSLPDTDEGVYVTDIEYNDDTNYSRVMLMFDDMSASRYTELSDNIEMHPLYDRLIEVFSHQHDYTTGFTDEDKEAIEGLFHDGDIRDTFQ